jgi:hypothetical protein
MLNRASAKKLAEIMTHARSLGYDKRTPTIGMRVCAVIEVEAERQNRSVFSLLGDAGVHHEVYGRWRRGRNNPTLTTVEKIESAGIRVFA